MAQAFDGIRIIDFSQVLAGPFAVMQLALLGAEVIKVEQPGGGDQTRGLMNIGEDQGLSPSFLGMNLNKQSLTLNLKAPEAIEIVKKLVATADVVVENFKAGTMERLGLSYEDLKEIKPDLIYCSVTGYGQTGPKAGEAAYDGAVQAASGMMSQNGHVQTGPTRTGYMPVDMSTALNTAFTISAALFRRANTGLGQRIDVAMMDTAIVMQASQYSNYLNQGNLVGLLGNASPTRQPTANVFATSDSHIQVTAIRQPQVEKLFEAIGETDQLTLEKFATPDVRIENGAEVGEIVASALKKETTEYWLKKLAALGIPTAEIRGLPEVINDPQFESRGVFETLPHPVDPLKEFTIVKAGYVLDADGPAVRSTPPLLGQHTDDVLASLGYNAQEIASLKEAQIC
jgi:crotonobetainyl-CoA:carnitine CoA-transferase CaiB-like acyl-CoA transferase